MDEKLKLQYYKKEWYEYRQLVLERDNYQCTKCGINKLSNSKVILQVHHLHYKKNAKPWEYPLSDCTTLCKNCHEYTHGFYYPYDGWILESISENEDGVHYCNALVKNNNNGGILRPCDDGYEQIFIPISANYKTCSQPLRYTYSVFHPLVGSVIVGSTCVNGLCSEDAEIASKYKRCNKIKDGCIKSTYNKWIHNHKGEYEQYLLEHFIVTGVFMRFFIFIKNNKSNIVIYNNFREQVFNKSFANKDLPKLQTLSILIGLAYSSVNTYYKNIYKYIYKSELHNSKSINY